MAQEVLTYRLRNVSLCMLSDQTAAVLTCFLRECMSTG